MKEIHKASTLSELWRRSVSTMPTAHFLEFAGPSGDIRTWTYGAFDQLVAKIEGRFAEVGIGPGDVIHLALSNCPTFIAIWMAAVCRGSVIVPSDRPLGAIVPRSSSPRAPRALQRAWS